MRPLAIFLCTAVLAALGQAQPQPITLPFFTRVEACVPFSVKLAPGPRHSVQLEAERAVQEAFNATVSSGTLKLTTTAPFRSTQPIRLTLTLPAKQLQSLASKGVADVVVAQGFSPAQLALSTAGGGRLLVEGVTAPRLTVNAAG